MTAPELGEKIQELLARIFELKQTVDAMTDAPPELVDRMSRVNGAAKPLENVLPEM